MIYSKQNLHIHDIAHEDKEIIGLDNVCFAKDGSTAALNRQVVVVVGPVHAVMRKNFPLESSENDSDEVVTSGTVKDVLKSIPRDNTFGGILENVELHSGKFTYTDGARNRSVEAKLYPREFPDYKTILRRAYDAKKDVRVAVNLRRLSNMLLTIERVCGADESTAIYLEFSKDNDIIIRCENPKTLQRIIALMNAYDRSGVSWKPLDEWETSVLTEEVALPVRKIKREKA